MAARNDDTIIILFASAYLFVFIIIIMSCLSVVLPHAVDAKLSDAEKRLLDHMDCGGVLHMKQTPITKEIAEQIADKSGLSVKYVNEQGIVSHIVNDDAALTVHSHNMRITATS